MKKILIITLMFTQLFTLFAQEKDWANLEKYKLKNRALLSKKVDANRVVFMGNSITEKWSIRNADFWEGKPYVNRGISGQVTAQMLLRFRPDVLALNPKVVVILAGTNDIAENKGPITLEQIAGNIFSMVELAQANNIKVILCSVLPAVQYKWRKSIQPADKIIELNKLIKQYATQNKIAYIDCYTPMVNDQKGLKSEFSPDGVHPNLKGYQLMSPLFERAIQQALNEN